MNTINYNYVKEKQLPRVFAPSFDKDGGVDAYTLNWEDDGVWIRGDYWDDGGIEDFFKDRDFGPFFKTLRETCEYIEGSNEDENELQAKVNCQRNVIEDLQNELIKLGYQEDDIP